MKLRGKILILSLLPITMATAESLFFTWLYLSDFPDAQNRILTPLCRIGIITLVITFAIVIFVTGRLIQHFKNVADLLTQLAKGNLAVQVSEKTLSQKDESGFLARDAVSLQNSLIEIIGHMEQSAVQLDETANDLAMMTDHTASVSEGLATAMSEIAQGASQEASSAQSIMEEVTMVKGLTDKSVDHVNSFRSLINEIHTSSSQGQSLIQKLNDNSETTQKEIAEIAAQTATTHQASQEIQTAAEFIASIASQTNLLALNASIEAARAGEQGRGFSVVAEQIKNLAEQSSSSAQNIDAVIKNLLAESDKTMACMNKVQEITRTENTDIRHTSQLFLNLNGNITKAFDEIGGISDHLTGLAHAERKIAAEIDQLSSTVEETAASTEEITASSEELNSTSEVLSDHAKQLACLSQNLRSQLERFTISASLHSMN